MSILKKVNELMAAGFKSGKTRKMTAEDKLKEVQQRGEKLKQNQEMAMAQQQQAQQQ